MERLDDQLDSVFADTFRNFGDPFRDSAFASSIDLRDQKDRYVVRLYVPGPDTSKVNAQVEGNVLHITASGEKSTQNASQSERYEQVISLPGPVKSKEMRIERKQNLVIVTLPKAKSALAAASAVPSPAASPFASSSNLGDFDDSIINRMTQMQARMNQMFQDAFPEENNLTSGFSSLRLGSAVHVDDQKNQYVVHFSLPDRDLQNVNVKLEDGQLRLSASESQSTKTKGARSLQAGNYEQIMTLPGPVKEKGMKVERKDGTIVVTLPKA